MKINKKRLLVTAEKIGITKDQAEKLWVELNAETSTQKFNLSNVLYYFGTMLIIFAMTWFMSETLELLGGRGIFFVGILYILIFLTLSHLFWKKSVSKTPSSLFVTLAVCMIPLTMYGFQKWMGWWTIDKPGQYHDFFS